MKLSRMRLDIRIRIRSQLQHTSECQVLLIRETHPDAASSDLEVEFKGLAIPLVNQAVATPGQFPQRG